MQNLDSELESTLNNLYRFSLPCEKLKSFSNWVYIKLYEQFFLLYQRLTSLSILLSAKFSHAKIINILLGRALTTTKIQITVRKTFEVC